MQTEAQKRELYCWQDDWTQNWMNKPYAPMMAMTKENE